MWIKGYFNLYLTVKGEKVRDQGQTIILLKNTLLFYFIYYDYYY